MCAPFRRFCAILVLPALLVACGDETGSTEAQEDTAMTQPASVETASVSLEPLVESGVRGTVVFTPVDGGMRVAGTFTGLSEGPHGFHIHEGTSCAEAGAAAGGHFSPEGSPHGAPENEATSRHTGDLGNLTAQPDGTGTYERVDALLLLDGPSGIVGKAMIVHAGGDDLTSQPSGDAGDRVACGIIQMDN